VEPLLERHDGHIRSTGSLVVHRRVDVCLGELSIVASTLLLTLPHESGFICELVGVRTSLGRKDLVEALWRDRENASLENVSPVMLREVAKRWTVDNGRHHLRRACCELQSGIVVPHRNGSNLSIDVEEHIAVKISNTMHCQLD
jgi:hypothetical protein